MIEQYYKVENYNTYQSIGYLTRRVSKLMTAQLNALFAVKDMTFVQYAVLMYIRDDVAITASEICQNLCHDTGALARIIDQLEARGYLTRARSEVDRRRVEMELTQAGREMLDELVAMAVDFWNGILTDFTREEADMMTNILVRMTDKLAALPKAEAA